MYPYLVTDNTITIVTDKPHTISNGHPKWDIVLGLVRSGSFDDAIEMMTPARAIETFTAGNLTIKDDVIYRNGAVVDHAMAPHILSLKEAGFDHLPMLRFLDKLLANPSARSRNQTWRFVSTNKITITPDGNLIFYKNVADDFFDLHTRKTHRYLPGTTHTMDRREVDDDPESTCSVGLHVCSYEYLRHFSGSRTLLVEVDPADIVSVPIDYENSKLRVCKLRVVREIDNPQPASDTTIAYLD